MLPQCQYPGRSLGLIMQMVAPSDDQIRFPMKAGLPLRIRGTQIAKEGVKLSFLPDNMIICGENPEKSTQKLQELRSEFSRVAQCKVIMQSIFLNTINKQLVIKIFRNTLIIV